MEPVSQIRNKVKIHSILGSKLDEKADCFKPVKFNINANLEELEHGFDHVSLGFAFVIVTEPKVVKYHVEGLVDIQGQAATIKRVLAPHPSTKVPMILYDVYQQVYASVFVLSKMIDAPSPSPELLSSSQAIRSLEGEEPEEEAVEETEATDEAPVEESTGEEGESAELGEAVEIASEEE